MVRPQPLLPSGVLGMAIFIVTEIMFFAGLISAFLVLRAQAMTWPPFDQPRLPVVVTGVNTAVLLASGWTMLRAQAALRRSQDGLVRWLGLTALLGALFVAVQGYEWVRLIHFGLTTSSSLYGATFYTLVGAHGLHVLAALVVLVIVLRGAAAGWFQPGDVVALEPYRMYWLFVVGIWPVLYVLVYLV
jgi:cytochrome c oxidase subunit 3